MTTNAVDAADAAAPQRQILLVVTGLTPQVVTETIYALWKHDPALVPTEVHLITTALGAEHARLNLLSPRIDWMGRLQRDYRLPAIDFSPARIHVIPGADGGGLDDIRSPDDNVRAADFITGLVRQLTADEHSTLHVSIAGGRKSMGYFVGYALSLFGRAQDRLSHVLVSAPFESHREFYYPTPNECPIHVRQGDKEVTYDCRHAKVDLAWIPFVRLRSAQHEPMLTGNTLAYILAKQRPPKQAPKLNTVIRLIASLGGFLGRKCDGEPAMKTLWLGLQRVRDFAEGMQFAQSLQGT